MVKIPNETRRRRCPTRNARRCAFWGFEKNIYIYIPLDVYVYIYMATECIPIKTERKTLVPPPPPATRLLPLNRKKILLNFQLVNPSSHPCNVCTDTAVIVRSFFFATHSPHQGRIRLFPSAAAFILRTCSAYREQ